MFAAVWAGRIVREQIKQSDRQEREKRQQRFVAARSTLPLTLSSISTYATDMADCLKQYHHQVTKNALHGLLLDAPPPPADAIAALERTIEATDSVEVNTLVRVMLSEIQLLQARAESLARPSSRRRIGVGSDIETILLQCAVIYAQAGVLFGFARFETDAVPSAISWEDTYNGLAVLDIDDADYPGLFKLCSLRRQNGTPPGSASER